MAGIEIREYCGDFEDLVELAQRVWIPEYAGRMWFSLPDAHSLRLQVAASGGGCIVAYHGTKPVGSIFSFPHSLRTRSCVLPIALTTGLSIEREHRRLVFPLIEQLIRFHEEREIAFALGGIATDPTSLSYRFWTKYAQSSPQKLQFLFSTGQWVKILAPRAVARAGINFWERLAANALGPLLRLTPHRNDPHVRSCRAGDLERCAQILNKAGADFDWAVVWTPQQLAYELKNPASEILVLERDGLIRAMVRYRCVLSHGREPIRAAMIELWADDGLTGVQRVRLLGHVCNHLRARDVHIVLALRCAMMPETAFLANLFLPPITQIRIGALSTRPERVPAPPETWGLPLG